MASITFPLPNRRRTDAALVRQVPWLRAADARHLAALAPHTDRLRLPPGRVVARAGDLARELTVVVAGEATVERPGHAPEVLTAGAQVGLAEVLCGSRHGATVVARSDLEVVVVNGPAVRWAQREGVGRTDRPAGATVPRPAPGRVPAAAGARA